MNQEIGFETMPFELAPEFQNEAFELEESERGRLRGFSGGRSRQRYSPPRPQTGSRPRGNRRPPFPRPGRIPQWPGRAWGPALDTYPGEPEPAGSERIRWIQDCLNQALGLQLPVTGIMGAETRSAVRNFQRQQGIRASGIVGPDTEQAIASACRPGPDQATVGDPSPDGGPSASEWGYEGETEIGDVFGRVASSLSSAYDRVVDVVGGASGSRIIDLTTKSDKSNRKGNRDPKSVYALVLHQMACCARRKDPLRSYLKIKSHFAILRDGTILQLHPISALLWASNGFNARSVAVEFAGNFPSTRNQWWQGDKFGRDRPTQAQFDAGRYLIRYLIRTMGLTHVLAHRQSSGTRENDPGPDIWSQVGQWAVDKLGLKDGGPGFKIGSGNPIPDAWRNWKSASATPEIGQEYEDEFQELEIAHDVEFGEAFGGSDREFGQRINAALRRANVTAPAYRDAGPLTATTVAALKGPGLYVIKGRNKKPYVGQTTDLKTRLQQHLWCAEHLGVPTDSFRVFVAERPDVAKLPRKEQQRQALRSEERRINAALVPTGLVTNKRTELEQELWGGVWN